MGMDVAWVIDRLESNADVFRCLLASVTDAQARWKPSPGKWSLLEVINHLADEETADFGARLSLILADPSGAWPPIDPERSAVDREYNKRLLGESLKRFLCERDKTGKWLRGLHRPDWQVAHVLPEGGGLRAGDLLCSWLAHDLIHIRQMNRLHYEYLSQVRGEFSTAYAGNW
jgi:hypothetical protein